MIEFLKGNLIEKQPHRIVLEIFGVGFEVLIPFSTFNKLGPEGTIVKILGHLHWREEGPQIFGFATPEERSLFRLFNSVSKIGPKLAVNILSAASPEKLVEMILTEDLSALTAMKGVGTKTGSRLIVELKEPISKLGFGLPSPDSSVLFHPTGFPHENEVHDALENLGYSDKEIDKAMKQVMPSLAKDASLPQLIEAVLKSFSR
ncbi:Holliday junction branch migration protein RuvA [bacterium]|nr:Holliday junction branch migration protein RuvA [bacterium]